mmetsp:Transcript_25474/g.53649  ORF Transcript_25474/g.53649 Transcript_25474/m.53649 type:complete len:95 (-) Transcript_25474:934-1218(-)
MVIILDLGIFYWRKQKKDTLLKNTFKSSNVSVSGRIESRYHAPSATSPTGIPVKFPFFTGSQNRRDCVPRKENQTRLQEKQWQCVVRVLPRLQD